MKQALDYAQKATRAVTPNPHVGAVVVRDNEIVGIGYHQKAGEYHAEILALEDAGTLANGASLYVTLEPCSTHGKTPACTDAIIKAGIKSVFIGCIDPNPAHSGKGILILQQHGIAVETGVLKEKCETLIEDFTKFITTGLPFVISKSAISADGKIATVHGESQWISSPSSRAKVQKIRQNADAILVGIGTVINDNPSLTVRTKTKNAHQPWRIVIDPECSIPENARLLNDNYIHKTILIVKEHHRNTEKNARLIDKGIQFLFIEEKNQIFNPYTILTQLARIPIVSLLIEGGGATLGHFFDFHAIDKMIFFIAPKIIGGKNAPSPFHGTGVEKIADAVQLKNVTWKKYACDMMLTGYPNWKKAE